MDTRTHTHTHTPTHPTHTHHAYRHRRLTSLWCRITFNLTHTHTHTHTYTHRHGGFTSPKCRITLNSTPPLAAKRKRFRNLFKKLLKQWNSTTRCCPGTEECVKECCSCCNVLQCVALLHRYIRMCCSVLQCVAVCCSVLHTHHA